MINKKTFLILALSCTMTACFHTRKIDIQQGNIITQAMVNQLTPGMSQQDVTKTLGTPVLINTFSGDRLDYIYTHRKAQKKATGKRLILHFTDGKLTQIDSDFHPENTQKTTT